MFISTLIISRFRLASYSSLLSTTFSSFQEKDKMASSLHPAVTTALSMVSGSRITYRSHFSQHSSQIGHESWHTVSFKNSCSLLEPVMLSFCNRPNPSLSNTLSPSGKGPVQAKLVRFKGRKDVCIPFQEGCLHPGAYLKETERIVKVTFPDSARIKYLGDSYWQARLQSITFFNFTATPYCDVRVAYEKEALHIDSNRLILDVTGLPEQFRNMDLQLALHGELSVLPRADQKHENAEWDFDGWVNLGVGINLPLPLSLIPEGLLTGVGNQIVDRVLRAMEGALLQGIITDYGTWCSVSEKASSSNFQNPVTVRGPRSSV